MPITSGVSCDTTDKEDRIRVISYNIWNGFEWGKDRERHAAFLHWMRSQASDVVALQELCGYDLEKLGQDARKWGHAHAAILKTDGYPVGLTSREPIALKERLIDGLWHGMLHAETCGIDFFVVHLSPADAATRLREAQIITARIRAAEAERFLILGDFNSHSPTDGDLDRTRTTLLERYRRSDADNKRYQNLRLGEFDYSVIATFLALPAIDVTLNHASPAERFSFPAPALIGQYEQTEHSVVENRERIDFVLASPKLATRCKAASIVNSGDTDGLSDHFPVVADFAG
ncbi:MAG: endonuclease/exonuclease/phosphatase family protein [Candidatus Latescibacterota bacterium]|nr:endonuclease/exonuclease/phosphatase family protein [Candidatus Latescibacterota bacterium]